MRVALFAHRLAPLQPTGVHRSVVELVQHLADQPDVVYEIAACSEPVDPAWLPPSVGLRRIPGSRALHNLSWGALGWPKVDRALGDPAVLHLLTPAFPSPARAPIVVTIHDLFALRDPKIDPRRGRWGLRQSARWAARHASRIVCPSEFVRGQVLEHLRVGPDRVDVVRWGVPTPFLKVPTPGSIRAICTRYGIERGCFIVAVGAVSGRKNLGPVVAAVEQIPDLVLVVAGPRGFDAESFDDAVARHKVSDRTVVTGFLTDDELVAIVNGASALVHPSRAEGFCFPVLEAMSVGVPVVASRAGSIPELVGDAGMLVDPSDVDDWVDALDRVLGDENVRRPLVDAGREQSQQFSWTAAARRMAAIHRSLG